MSFWEDRRAPKGHMDDADYPMFQWYNGVGTIVQGLPPVVATGGFEFPVKAFRGIIGDKMEVIMFPHGSGGSKQEPGYGLKQINFCVVNMVLAWVVNDGKTRQYYPFDTGYREGAKSHAKLIGFVKEVDEAAGRHVPVVMTISRTAAKDVTSKTKAEPGVLTQFRTDVLNTASGIAGYRMPHYALYVPMAAGARELVGSSSQSMATRIVPNWELGDDAKAGIEKLAVPDDLFEYIKDTFFDEAKDWVNRTQKLLFSNGVDKSSPTEYVELGNAASIEFKNKPPDYFKRPEFAINWAIDEADELGVKLFNAPQHAENAYAKVRNEMISETPDGESAKDTARRIRNAWVEYVKNKLEKALEGSIPL